MTHEIENFIDFLDFDEVLDKHICGSSKAVVMQQDFAVECMDVKLVQMVFEQELLMDVRLGLVELVSSPSITGSARAKKVCALSFVTPTKLEKSIFME